MAGKTNGKGKKDKGNGGKYVTGTWAKGGIQDTFTFTLEDGSPLAMAPGQTYVELPNSSAKIIIKS